MSSILATAGALAGVVPPLPPLLSAAPPARPAPGDRVPVQVVFTTIAGHATARVPGEKSLAFLAAPDRSFGRPVASPDGRHWIVRAAVIDDAGAAGEAILVGDGDHAVLAARTGQPAPGEPGSFASFDDEMTIGDDGVFTFRAQLGGGLDAAADGEGRASAFLGRIREGAQPVLAAAAGDAADGAAPEECVGTAEPEEGAELVEFTLAALLVTPAGDWLARGTDASGNEWVFRNGEPVALGGAPVTLDPAEHESFTGSASSPAFFSMDANGLGDVVVGGLTDAGSGGRSAAVILNNQRVILREGDPVDLDADGRADDDAFIHAFSTDGAFLSDSGWYSFSATLRDGAGQPIGQALLRAGICKPDWDASGAPNSSDIAAFITAWATSVSEGLPLADYNRDGVADSADVASFLAGWVDAIGGGC